MEYKRRRSLKGTNTGTSRGFVIALIITGLIALIAGIIAFSSIGEHLTESVIRPLFSCSSGQKEDDVIISALSSQDAITAEHTEVPKPSADTRESVMMEETPFYILQMGAFTDSDAAAEHADQIKRMGGGGVLFADGSVFRVFAAAYADESSLVKVQGQVRSDGFEATPYITDKRAVKITFEGNSEAISILKNAVLLSNVLPSELTSVCLSYDKSELSYAQAFAKVQQLFDGCSSCIEEMTSIQDPSVLPIRTLLTQYQEKLSTFIREHDSMNKETVSAELKSLQLYIIIDYISFFEKK